MLLHTLITERQIGRDVVKFVRDQKALTYVADCLEENNEKLLHIVVGIVTHLCDRSNEQQVRTAGYFEPLGWSVATGMGVTRSLRRCSFSTCCSGQ